MSVSERKGSLIKTVQQLQPKRQKGVNLYSMKNSELIHLIQKKEGNSPCFASEIARVCGHTHCRWYSDCKKSANK